MRDQLNDKKADLARDVVAKLIQECADRPLEDNEEILAFEVNVIIKGKDHFARSGFSVGPFEVLKLKLQYEEKIAEMVKENLGDDLPDLAKAILREKLKKCLFD